MYYLIGWFEFGQDEDVCQWQIEIYYNIFEQKSKQLVFIIQLKQNNAYA